MSIQTELTRITNAKAAIVAAIEGKGVTVPDGAKLDALAALIGSIQAGGGGGINLGDYFTNITVASITPAEDMTIGSGVFAALNISKLQGTTFVVANNEYRKSIGNSYVRLAFYPRLVYAGIWRILYGTGTSLSKEEWSSISYNDGGSTYRLKAGIKYEVVYIEAPY